MVVEVKGNPVFVKKYGKLPEKTLTWKNTKRLIELLKKGENKGDFIRKSLYPKKYKSLFNLFRYNLNGDRALFTIITENRIKTYVLLDILTHNEYDKLFNYSVS